MKVDVETFKKLHLREFDITLTDEEAERRARLLMSLYKAIYGSPKITQNKYEQTINKS